MESIILMAHGAPQDLNDVEEYVLRVRQGRPLDPLKMAEIRRHYELIGGSPLLNWTTRQADALEELLKTHSDNRKVYLGMRHSAPFIKNTVEQMIADGVRTTTAICLTPQFSNLTIGAYRTALEAAIDGRDLQFRLIPSYARHPRLIQAFAANLNQTLEERPRAFVVFTAHSLPESVLRSGDPYDHEVKSTACLVAKACNLTDWRFAYQSQGMTSDKWLGSTVESRIDEIAAKGFSELIIQPIGFVCDHVEILYDIDIHYRDYASAKGINVLRPPSLNDSRLFIDLLFQLAQR
jgi:protoporphyrin/coproporphyrin ferrochelatase